MSCKQAHRTRDFGAMNISVNHHSFQWNSIITKDIDNSKNSLTDGKQYQDVRQEECSSAVFVGGEGKPPHVSQADGHGDAGQKELHAVAPSLPFGPVSMTAVAASAGSVLLRMERN